MHYILRGQYDAALRQLQGAKASGASPAGVENLHGLALMLRGDATSALAHFDRALEIEPTLHEARLNRAIALLRAGEPAKASRDLETIWADAAAPVRADAAYHNAIALDRLERPGDAEVWLARALTLDASFDAALLYLGMLRERRGDLQGAGRAYLSYLERHPDSAAAALRFGLSAQKSGRIDVARTYLQRAIAAAPDSREAIEARKFLVMWE